MSCAFIFLFLIWFHLSKYFLPCQQQFLRKSLNAPVKFSANKAPLEEKLLFFSFSSNSRKASRTLLTNSFALSVLLNLGFFLRRLEVFEISHSLFVCFQFSMEVSSKICWDHGLLVEYLYLLVFLQHCRWSRMSPYSKNRQLSERFPYW